MSNVAINIAAEFTGKKAFKQADTATQKLTNNVKKLAGATGIAFGASAIIAYSKASVKAFAQDEAAALRLNRAVENLGIGFANPQIADYIANLEKSAAIADDVLRPAFQGLLTTTGSLTQSQKLLNDAITISRASGVDLATVSEDLGKGYIGITRGLAKYNTVGGGTEASDAAKAIESLAKGFNLLTLGTGTAIGGLTSVLRNLKNLPKNIFEGFVGKQFGVTMTVPKKVDPVVSLSEKKQQQALAALEVAAIKRQKELNALKNKQLDTQRKLAAEKKKQEILDKYALLLAQGKKVFDEEGIQLAAAAQGKLTEEERVRVALKKDIYDLEAAISEENLTAAARLSNSMISNAQKLSQLRGDMVNLGSVPNPFDEWLSTLQAIAAQLAALANYVPPIVSSIGIGMGGFNAGSARLGESASNAAAGLPASSLSDFMGFGDTHLGNLARQGAVQTINLTVQGSVSTERDLVSAITQGLYAQQAAGTPVNYSTVY